MNLSQCHFTEVHFMPPYPLRCSPSAVTPRERRLDAALRFVPSWTHSIVPDLKVLTYYRKSGWYHIPHQLQVSRTWILWKNMQSTQSNGAFDWVQKHHNFQNSRKFPKISENSRNKVFKPMLMEDSMPVSTSNVPTFLRRRWAPQTHRLRWSHLNCLAWCTPGN